MKKHLPHDVFRLFDERTTCEILIADLSDSTLTPTSLTVRVKGRLGRKIDECLLDVHAYDFWQNDLVRESFKPSVDGDWEKTWIFPAPASCETRAIVRYSRPDGKYVRKFLNARGDVTALKRFVVPCLTDVRLVALDMVGGADLATADFGWVHHVRNHLGVYLERGPAALNGDCFYCLQLKTWEHDAFRREGVNWLRFNAGLCVRGTGGGGERGGTSHGH